MKILYFNGYDEDGDTRTEPQDNALVDDDGSTTEFLDTKISNIDFDGSEDDLVTLYTTGHGFYIILSKADVENIVRVVAERVSSDVLRD